MVGQRAAALLQAMHEPALLVARDGTVLCANRPLERMLGERIEEQRLSTLLAGDAAQFEAYLERCVGSGEPLVGTLMLRIGDGARKAQCKGNGVRWDDEVVVLLRLSPSGEPRFAALTRTVADLREELRKRMRSEAMLEEALAERELLVRELEHRVKNNMQMLSALLSGAEREAESAEAKAALKEASLRFSAVGAVQQLLYRSKNLGTIEADALVSTLTDAVATLSSEPAETSVTVESIDLPIDSAVSIGLILNELLTNAVKHGRPAEGTQRIGVDFTRKGDKLELTVQDNGPGFDLSDPGRRASGVGLVRGLLRQLGGSFRVERDGGTRCIVSFPEPGRTAMRKAG